MVCIRAQVIPPFMEATEKDLSFPLASCKYLSPPSFQVEYLGVLQTNNKRMNPWKVHLFLGLHLTLYVTPQRRSLERLPLPACPSPFPPQFEGGVSLGERFLGLMGLFPFA